MDSDMDGIPDSQDNFPDDPLNGEPHPVPPDTLGPEIPEYDPADPNAGDVGPPTVEPIDPNEIPEGTEIIIDDDLGTGGGSGY